MARLIEDLKQRYDKWIVTIAFILFLLGLTMIIFFEDNNILFIAGTVFIQLGITTVVVDLFISKWGRRLLIFEIVKVFRKILGIEDPQNTLLPELIHIMRPHPYHILQIDSNVTFFYDKDKIKEPYNMYSKEKIKLTIQPREDNIHYHFFRGTPTGDYTSYKLVNLKIDSVLLHPKNDIIEMENKDNKITEYILKHRLKKNKKYIIEMEFDCPTSMSDLKSNVVKEDNFICKYIELTNKSISKFNFPFNVNGYWFMVKRKDSCGREKFIECTPKNKTTIVIKQENLDNGDSVCLTYTKK